MHLWVMIRTPSHPIGGLAGIGYLENSHTRRTYKSFLRSIEHGTKGFFVRRLVSIKPAIADFFLYYGQYWEQNFPMLTTW